MKLTAIQRSPLPHRTGYSLCRQPLQPRKQPMRRVSKASISKAKKMAWDWCSKYVRLRDRIPGTEKARCVTCGLVASIRRGENLHAGHFIASRSNAILYDVRAIHAQCWWCNFYGGRTVARKYEAFMLRTYGAETVAELKALSRTVVNMTAEDHAEKADYFWAQVQKLGGWTE